MPLTAGVGLLGGLTKLFGGKSGGGGLFAGLFGPTGTNGGSDIANDTGLATKVLNAPATDSGFERISTAASAAAPALQQLTSSTTTASSGLSGFSSLLGSLGGLFGGG